MRTYNVHEAKTHFSRLLARVAAGEEVLIARAGEVVAKVVPVKAQRTRHPDGYRDSIVVGDDFDHPLPEDLLDRFEGGS